MSAEAFSFPVLVARIPPAGKHFRVAPNDEQRRAVADALGIVDITALTADLEVRPVGAEAFAVRGTLHAAVVQTDVVTLDPVRKEVIEAVDVTLLPASAAQQSAQTTGVEAAVDQDLYYGGRIDLGAIAVEHLALGLDPYPRSPDAEFPGHIEDDSSAGSSAFATLARLKRERE